MAYQAKSCKDWREHTRKCRESAAVRCSDNIYEQMRVRIVRVVREVEYCIEDAAEILGISENTVRKYLRFVPFEHLLADEKGIIKGACRKWNPMQIRCRNSSKRNSTRS